MIELCQNEIEILKNTNFPLITKYYKSIKEGDSLYIIMEFMDNGDLSGLIKAHKILNKPIGEEKLWNIFIQAMKSLLFIHSKNLVHRDVKPENLFISNEGTIKLGDFGVSASIIENNKNKMELLEKQKQILSKWISSGTCVGTPPFMSPEMLKKETYDLKTDVYSMGCAFFEAMYWNCPRSPVMDISALFGGNDILKLVDLPIKNNKDYYSKELVNIIYQMIEKDKNKRPNSEQVLNMLIYEFNKKYSKNSSIGSVLFCLYFYQELTDYFKRPNNEKYVTDNSVTKNITFAYLYAINALKGIINEDWNNSLCNIRNIISKKNNIFEGNKEIDPRFVLSFLLGKIHQELNQAQSNYNNPFESLFAGELNEDKINMPNNSIDYSNKSGCLNLFANYFNQNYKSVISDYFYGSIKLKTACKKCNLTTYTYECYYFLTFKMNALQPDMNPNNQINIADLFATQNNILLELGTNKYFHCRKCQKVTTHLQRKQFNTFPKFLVICLDRGNNCKNKRKLSYGIDLNLTGQCDDSNSSEFYRLIGVIKRVEKQKKEHYISICFNSANNCWLFADDGKINNIQNPFAYTEGLEVMLFYLNVNKNINQDLCNQFNNLALNNNNNNFFMNNNINNNMNNNTPVIRFDSNLNNNMINNMNNNAQVNMNYQHHNSQDFMNNNNVNNYNQNLNNFNMINRSNTFT